jgi:CelD/BcsL family acetyltransferase involved in cellulose biosynthesis
MSIRSESAVTSLRPSSASPSPVLTDVIDLREPTTLADAWEDLFRAAGREPSTSFEWTLALLQHFIKPGDRTILIRAWRDGRLVALLPLLARAGTWFRQKVVTLSPLSEQCGTHSDILIRDADDTTVDALVRQLFELDLQWEYFRMTKLREDTPLLSALERSFQRHGMTYDIHDDVPEYYAPLPGSLRQYLEARSSKFRNYHRRVEGRLARRGQVGVMEIADAREFPAAWEAILRIERASWKQAHGSSIPETPWERRFFRDAWQGALERGRLDLHFLTIDRVPVAYDLGYLHRGCYAYLKTSYDHAYRYESPATALRVRLIERLIDRGVTSFEFPGPLFAWEQQWTNTVRWHKSLWLYNRNVPARVLALINRWRQRHPAARVVTHVDPRGETRAGATR